MDIHPELVPFNAEELTTLGRELILAEKYDFALTVLQESLGKDPSLHRTYILLAYLLELHGNYDAAHEIFENYKMLKNS